MTVHLGPAEFVHCDEPPLSGAADVGGSGSVIVLVADENEVAQRLCGRARKAGYKVLTASDGLEAVSLALANSLQAEDLEMIEWRTTGSSVQAVCRAEVWNKGNSLR